MISRRLKRIEIEPEIVLELFRKSGKCWTVIDSEIPSDVEFRGIAHNASSNTWSVFFSHPSFEEVEPGMMVPSIRPPSIQNIELRGSVYEVMEKESINSKN